MMDTAISRKAAPVNIPGYELKMLVGHGGMGEVHQAVQLSLGRMVAVKLLKPELASDEQFVGRFEKEGAALASLRHPHVVSIVDRGNANGTYYLVMEFVDGPSLREKLRDADFGVQQALHALYLVARAIEYAHGRGVIHRDLKPENILFDVQAGNIPKVTDFGLAGLDESFGPLQRNLTQTHVSMGTAAYMAPEQAVDAKSAGPRADLYSLGVMLYEACTGELPMGTFDAPSMRKPGLDKRLDAIISRCLKPDPNDRYPSATALLQDLERVVAPNLSSVAPSKETPPQRLFRRAREIGARVGRIAAVTVVLFALTVLGAAFLRSRVQDSREVSGVSLMTDFGARFPLDTVGRLDRTTRLVTMGEGPDTIGLMALGRKPTVTGGTIDFGVPEDEQVGRVVVDAEVEGSGLEFSAKVDTQSTTPSRLEPLWELFRGPRAEPRSALMLLGEHGRYVALIISGGHEEPTLEWNLGPDKRGVMQAPLPVKAEGQRLALRVDAETGELFAVSGEGRDARLLGDGLWLGPAWRQLLGESYRAGLGCIAGRCVFREVTVQGIDVPAGLSPPPFPREDVVAPEAVVVAAPVKHKVVATKPKVIVKPVVRAPPPRLPVAVKKKK